MACPTRALFLHLKNGLEKLLDLTCSEASILHFLNHRIIQSPQDILMDQTSQIKTKILHEYFLNVPPSSIPKTPYPFLTEAAFEKLLYEAPPLVGCDLQQKEKTFKFSFNHLVSTFMHIAGLSHSDLACACMRFSATWQHQMPQFLMLSTKPFVTYITTLIYQLCIHPNNYIKVMMLYKLLGHGLGWISQPIIWRWIVYLYRCTPPTIFVTVILLLFTSSYSMALSSPNLARSNLKTVLL